MKHCAEFEELMVDSLYGHVEDVRRAELEAHVGECDKCARMFSDLRATLDVMSRRERHDPGPAYWESYWDRLAERIERGGEHVETVDTTDRRWWRMRVGGSGMSWTYRVAAAAAILVMGIFVGRTFFVPAGEVTQPAATAQREVEPGVGPASTPGDYVVPATGGDIELASSNERAMRYVGKSQVLLLGLINSDPETDGYVGSLETQRQRSRQLVGESASIQESLSNPRQRRLRELVAELEKILIQIANLESEEDFEQVEFIRGRVNRHDVLLKINLEQLKHANGTGAGNSANDGDREEDPRKGSI